MQDVAATSGDLKTQKNPGIAEIKEAEITHEEVKETNNLDTKCGEKTEKGSEVVINIDDKLESDDENQGTEKVCRICHLNEDQSMEMLELGCDCKAELGVCHRHCAEAWFNQRGNRSCEICGKTAKNVETRTLPETQNRIMVVEWNHRAIEARRSSYISNSSATHNDCRWRCQQSCCNFLLACFVVAFTLPWFFRLNLP
ncbi:uncharacterized protein LOC132036162 [Lycium ferocissimum]|uniref:uncharacterized protein LOC132036162 n=1 Tax=Lycium ferocissimum TaxID=112874 RepID=UPI0028153AE5|nr:uncharacterized protein LOC132036162 [Lycium ferocissimum]